MAVPVTFRGAAVALLVVALGLAALPGCGSKPAPTESKGEQKPDKTPPKPDEKKDDKKGAAPVEPKTALSDVEPAAEQAATAFLRDLVQGSAKAEALSPALLDALGKPWELPDDIAKKVSPGAAERWLRTVGAKHTFSPSQDRKQAGDVAYFRGSLQEPGGYSLRLVKVDGAWKVDWVSVSSAELKGKLPADATDEAFQAFAVAAFAEVLGDATGMPADLRSPVLARGMVPALRAAWAAPFDADKAQGYDYSPGKLKVKAIEYGGGTSAFGVAKAGEATYTVEFTKPAGKKTITVKLAKGSAPGEWLVSEVTEKG